jgi:LmbE family N-acetylglucosaminyl deacetylase
VLLVTALLATAARAGTIGGELPPIDATTSLLVVSPHPDDETLCCAGVIRRVVTAGGRVSVVWITNGDGSWLSMLLVEKSLLETRDNARELAAKRMAEARAATALLGVDSTRQFFLGYPDGGIRKLLTDNRSSLERDFTAVLDRVRPTLILAPSPLDTHPDHEASGLLAIRALSRRGELTKAHFWIVHGGEGWPSPRGYMPGIPLNTPPRGAGLAMLPFALTDDEETSKLQAVNAYHTQLRVMAPFLLAFVRTSEIFSASPVHPAGSATP